MQKSFNLLCFIGNYARPSNPAKYLLRAREAGALGLPSAERRILAMRPRLPALGRMSRCGCSWSGCAHFPFHSGQQVQTQALTFPHPCGPTVNIYVVGSFPSKGSVIICPWGSFMAVLPEKVPSNPSDEEEKGESGLERQLVWQLQKWPLKNICTFLLQYPSPLAKSLHTRSESFWG